MKVAVDARMLKMSGIGTYIQQLLKHKCYDIAIGNTDDLLEYKEQHYINDTIEFNSKIYGIKEQLKFPYKQLKKMKPDVLHIPHYNVPIFYRGKMIVTIHDLTHLVFPEFLPNKIAYFYAKFMIWFAIKRAYKIITVSQNTKKDILQRFKVKPEKIEVIYLAAGDEFVEKPKEEIDYLYERFNIPRGKKLLMYVGNLKPHKNLEKLLDAFSLLDNKDDYCLLLVGKAFKNYKNLDSKEKELSIKDNIIHTGIVTQEELVDLYNLVDLFVFPSLYEGFGIPVLEALNCNTPVICSNTSSLPEVGGELVEYFNPYDELEIKKKIESNINRKSTINKIMADDERKKFDWNETVKFTKKLF